MASGGEEMGLKNQNHQHVLHCYWNYTLNFKPLGQFWRELWRRQTQKLEKLTWVMRGGGNEPEKSNYPQKVKFQLLSSTWKEDMWETIFFKAKDRSWGITIFHLNWSRRLTFEYVQFFIYWLKNEPFLWFRPLSTILPNLN